MLIVGFFSFLFAAAVVQSLSRVQLCDPMDYSTLGFPVLHHFPELAQINVELIINNELIISW